MSSTKIILELEVDTDGVGLLFKAMNQFRYYQHYHERKLTSDGPRKAEVNKTFADEIEEWLRSRVTIEERPS